MILIVGCACSSAFAQDLFDATHLFEEEVSWLADNVQKESKDEFSIRTRGFVQYADTKPVEVGDVESFNSFNIAKKWA